MKRLEALADAIMQFEGWKRGTRAWRNRNPGNLRPLSASVAQSEGYRVFDSLAEGYQALLDDLKAKLAGSHGLTAESTLLDLINIYAPAADRNNPTQYADFIAKWVSVACDENVYADTKLKDFTD